MTALSIGEIILGLQPAKRTRSFQPVRRSSYHRGEREHLMWRPIATNARSAKRLLSARLRAAKQFEYSRRRAIQRVQPGKRNGPLGDVGLLVLEALHGIVDFKTGRLEPSIAWIADKICKSRSAVINALAALREHGFIDWIRRTEPVNNDGEGPQVKQISNAYGICVPAEVARFLGNGPLPDCEVARKEADRIEFDAMLEKADPDQIVDANIDDPALAAIMKRLGAGIYANSASLRAGQNPGE